MRAGKGDGSLGQDQQVFEDDRKFCPHCKRKFNAIAAERHIPICAAKHRAKGVRI
jgi:hypothetical protein